MNAPGASRIPVLFLHSSSDLYGSDRSLIRTIDALAGIGVEPVVCLPYDGPLVAHLRSKGITAEVVDLAVLRRGTLTPLGLLGFPFRLLAAVLRVRSLARRKKIRLVHTNTSAVLVGGFVAWLLGLPHVWHIREILLTPAAVRRGIAWCVRRFATVVVGVSTSVIENLERDQPDIRSIARVLHNGIATRAFREGQRGRVREALGIGERDVLVGMIGRVGTWKGQEFFLRSMAHVLAARPAVKAVAIGGPFRGYEERFSELKREVRDLGLEKRFLVEDFREDVADVLAALDIFVLPSVLPDPFPTTVLEAMAAGKPVVANGHGGVTEMLEDGRSGALIPVNDEAAMAEAIRRLVDDPGLRREWGSAARARVVERFDVGLYTREICALMAGVIHAGRAGQDRKKGLHG